MRKIIIILFLFNLFLVKIKAQEIFSLKEGDILFQDLDCGDFCDAIEAVTIGYKGSKLSHVGIVVKQGVDELIVAEAISSGVILTKIDTFLLRSIDIERKPKVIVGRLKPEYQKMIKMINVKTYSLIGKSYDEVFDSKNHSYYCSELVYEVFRGANMDQDFFKLEPMTFKNQLTKVFFPIWIEYFKKQGVPIPEGMPGINPGSISRSDKLIILTPYGKPDGLSLD